MLRTCAPRFLVALAALGLSLMPARVWGQAYVSAPTTDSPCIPLPETATAESSPAAATSHDGEFFLPAAYWGEPAKSDTAKSGAGKSDADLSARVAALEKALKDAKAKEAETKAKAAGRPTVTPGGRIFMDSYFFDQSDLSHATYGNAENTAMFRAARLMLRGDAFYNTAYQIELDFAQGASYNAGTMYFKDTFITLQELPLAGNMMVGHYKEPVGLEQRTSDNYVTFLERSLPDCLTPSRNMGVSFFDWSENERMTWMVGTFAVVPENPPSMISDDGPVSIGARFTYLPWYDEATEGRGLVHLGLGTRYQNSEGTSRFYTRPEVGAFSTSNGSFSSTYVADTGNFSTTGYATLVPEFLYVYGPFSLQAEWMNVFTDGYGAIGNANLNGYYVAASYFLTGEHRRYLTKQGLPDRVKPLENFFRVRTCDGTVATGMGAWELVYRYSTLDLNDFGAGVRGGQVFDHTLGVNWYWNPYTRVMFDYVHSTSELAAGSYNHAGGGGGTENIFETRFQIDF